MNFAKTLSVLAIKCDRQQDGKKKPTELHRTDMQSYQFRISVSKILNNYGESLLLYFNIKQQQICQHVAKAKPVLNPST